MLRIIGGQYRSRQLQLPLNTAFRPTTGQLREAFFNMIGSRLAGCSFLDLFAGSGAMGIEALSRGAERALFVEKESDACRAIAQNIERLSLKGQSELVAIALPKALDWIVARRGGEPFDLIFADPPYEEGRALLAGMLPSLLEKQLLSAEGLLAIEVKERFKGKDLVNGLSLELIEERIYGKSRLCLYRRTGEGLP